MASSPLPAGDQASTQYSHLLKLRWLLMAVFVAVILLSLVADFMLGPSGLSWSELMRTLFSPDQAEPTTSVIVWDVRLPYAVMAVVVGLGLGLAGAEMQTILANPLASPFTLGISSAAAFGASLALVLDREPALAAGRLGRGRQRLRVRHPLGPAAGRAGALGRHGAARAWCWWASRSSSPSMRWCR